MLFRSEISDAEYDKLIEELKELDSSNSVLMEVGSTPSYGKKIKHKRIMGSLSKATFVRDENGDIIGDGLQDLRKWEKEHPEKKVWSYKIDGLAGKLVYKNGKLVEASSRGNGVTGSDLTDNVKAILSVPNEIELKNDEVEILGEFYIPWSFFNEHMKGKYSNPRNAASGSIQCEDPQETAERGLEFLVYKMFIDGKEPESKTKEEKIINSLKGFKYNKLFDKPITAELIEKLDQHRSKLDFMADGLVIAVDNRDERDAYGILSERYPKGMLAWKFKAENVTTLITDIEWQTGRTGKITPVAILTPIQIAGSIVSRATLHNISEIRRLGTNIGNLILLEKAGDIIPKIIRVVENNGNYGINYPDVCPSCGEPTSEDGTHVWCENLNCPARLATTIEYYLKTLEIKEIGPAMIEALIDNGFIKELTDMYKVTKEQILTLPNTGERSAEIFIEAMNSRKELDLNVFLRSEERRVGKECRSRWSPYH